VPDYIRDRDGSQNAALGCKYASVGRISTMANELLDYAEVSRAYVIGLASDHAQISHRLLATLISVPLFESLYSSIK
jgi:hypothetical protein